jgi:hypothetical protein
MMKFGRVNQMFRMEAKKEARKGMREKLSAGLRHLIRARIYVYIPHLEEDFLSS